MALYKQISAVLILLSLSLLSSCDNKGNGGEGRSSSAQNTDLGNGIYYWKTAFSLSDWDKNFLNEYHIKKLYVRLFDVETDNDSNKPIPVATTRFAEKVPQNIEIVPVVYITNSSMTSEFVSLYDTVFYKRVLAMGKRNGFEKIREIQLDCDWTRSTETDYFDFCSRIRDLAKNDGITISATIRLHQLKGKVPPVDRGVLMLYNTGSLYNPGTKNSILNMEDVKPYLKSDISYPLPLSFAYPTYGWGILLRNGEFAAILHQTDFADGTLYKPVSGNSYEVIKEHYLENKLLKEGDRIRLENSDMDEIRKVQKRVASILGKPLGTLIYHLDSLNLSHFSSEDINTILQQE